MESSLVDTVLQEDVLGKGTMKILWLWFKLYTRMQINGRIFVLVYPQQLNQSLPDEEAQVNNAKVT